VPPAGDRTVKRLIRLSKKALIIPDIATVADACRRMATRPVDAALLTDPNAIIYGIITDKDVAMQVVAEGRPIEGKFRHLPVVRNGEVVALLEITKFLYDAIASNGVCGRQGQCYCCLLLLLLSSLLSSQFRMMWKKIEH